MCVLRTLSPFQIGKICCPDFIFMDFMMKKRKKRYFQKFAVFPSDLATCHFSHSSQAWMHQNGLKFVPKDQNPPAAPQIRPIEQFWSTLKQKVYEGNWSAKDRNQLIRRIKKCAIELEPRYITNMFQNLKNEIHQTNKFGLTSLL